MPENAQLRAAIYARVSLDKTGEGLSVTTQIADAKKLARKRKLKVVAEFKDTESAKGKVTRTDFVKLLAAIRDGQLDVVIARHLDRLTRAGRDRLELTEACKENNVTIALTHGSDIDMTTSSGRFTMGILGEVAQLEIDMKSERQKRAERHRAERGLPPNKGHRATGYKLTGEIIPAEAKVVRKIFKRFLATDNIRGLAAELDDAGVPTRTRAAHWNPASVKSILTNPRYCGRVVYDGEVLEGVAGKWKPIIKPETFDLVQARLSDPARKVTGHSTHRAHLGTGLYHCGICDQPMTGLGGGSYRCKTKGHVSRSRTQLDTFVRKTIADRLRRKDLADLLDGTEDGAVAELLSDARDIRTRMALVDEDYMADLIDARLHRAKTDRLKAELADVERTMTARHTGSSIGGVLAAPDPATAFENADLATQRAVVDELATIRLKRHTRGSTTFDPDTVVIDWKA